MNQNPTGGTMKLKKIAALLAVAGLSTSAFATNGDNLIGLGAQSRALGGTSTAAFYGAESALANPALLAKEKGTEFSIAATAFMPDVSTSSNVATFPGAATSKTSAADMFAIPEVSLANRISDNLVLGLGMYGTSGMGVDYRGNNALFNAYSNVQMMKFVPSVAYNGGNFGLGAALAMQYGALELNYTDSTGATVGNGSKSDFGYGFNLGAYYDVSKELTLGVAYQSEIAMTYKGQLTTAANGFGIGPCAACTGTITSDKLTQPAEFKLGAAYTTGNWLLAADYKRVYWGNADGYKTFNWHDQDVFGLGAKYSGSGWWAGVGYNYGKDPIKVLPGVSGTASGYPNQAINMFNNVFFPAIVDSHFTFGGGYNIGKNSAIDMAVVYAPKVTKTIDTGIISDVMGTPPFGTGAPANMTTDTTTHSQTGVTVSVRMNF
jgi:long-chain fatty acid transport protein